MKYVIAVTLILLGGCSLGPQTGEGAYTGKLVDVSWEGIRYKSCEIRQQTGYVAPRNSDGSSSNANEERASSPDKELCDKLKTLTGKEITILYTTHAWAGLGLETPYVIRGIKE